MRLTPSERAAIADVVARLAGHEARVTLFGSRTRDERRGGDIDLLVELPAAVERPALLAAQLETALARVLGEQKIDIVLAAPNLRELAVHRVARREGIAL
jgi:predicted nucleotidyltransferase